MYGDDDFDFDALRLEQGPPLLNPFNTRDPWSLDAYTGVPREYPPEGRLGGSRGANLLDGLGGLLGGDGFLSGGMEDVADSYRNR